VRFEARPARQRGEGRQWVVTVEFFQKNRWIKGEAKVRAGGPAGALTKGLREVKRAIVKPRSRVASYRVTLVPVPKGR
jgi:hypothetical protein